MCRNETPYPIWMKFCTMVDVHGVITCTHFCDDRLRDLRVSGVEFCTLPSTLIVVLTTLSVALPCGCVKPSTDCSRAVGEPVDGRRREGAVHGDEQLRACDMRRHEARSAHTWVINRSGPSTDLFMVARSRFKSGPH